MAAKAAGTEKEDVEKGDLEGEIEDQEDDEREEEGAWDEDEEISEGEDDEQEESGSESSADERPPIKKVRVKGGR